MSPSIPWRRRQTEFRKELQDMVERFMGEEFGGPGVHGVFHRDPPLDMVETDSDVILRVECPGVNPEDFDINISGNLLTITGQKKDDREIKGEKVHRDERWFGNFSRSIVLPCEVQESGCEATYKDGIITVLLPKTRPKGAGNTIKVKVG